MCIETREISEYKHKFLFRNLNIIIKSIALIATYCVLVFDRLLDAKQKHSEDCIQVKRKAAIRGQMFSTNSVYCIPTCCINHGLQFKLASNMAWRGVFDDVEIGRIDDISITSHFSVQLKSKSKHHITMKQLLAGKGDFS